MSSTPQKRGFRHVGSGFALRLRSLACSGLLLVAFAYAPVTKASSEAHMEERFQDLFITAGYCTAFGAALGTALLAWTSEPAENLKYVAVGASMGFIGGSILGTYVVFSPLVVDSSRPESSSSINLLASSSGRGLKVQPIWDHGKQRLSGIASSMTIATF